MRRKHGKRPKQRRTTKDEQVRTNIVPPAKRSDLSRLPNELLSEVFVLCLSEWPLPSVRDAPLVFERVCRKWRDIARKTPRLWSRLSLQVQNIAGESDVPPIHERIASMWHSRSGVAPFWLCIHQQYRDDDGATDMSNGRNEALLTLVKRCSVLKLIIANQPFLELIIAVAQNAPCLQALTVSVGERPIADEQEDAEEGVGVAAGFAISNNMVQKLRVLNLSRTNNDLSIIVDAPRSIYGNLNRIAFEQSMHWSDVICWLTLCPNLEEAKFNIFDNAAPNVPVGCVSTIYISHVRKLTLEVNAFSPIDLSTMVPLQLPSMEYLALDLRTHSFGGYNRMSMQQVARLLLQGATNLSHLCIRDFDLIGMREVQIAELLSHTSQIKFLTFTGRGERLFGVLRRLSVCPPHLLFLVAERNVAGCCPNLEHLDISSCCWNRGLQSALVDMIISRYGISSYRYNLPKSEGRRRYKTSIREFELDKGMSQIEHVTLRKHTGSVCKFDEYDLFQLSKRMKKDQAIQRCIAKGLVITAALPPLELL